MKKLSTKIFSVLLTLVLLLGAVPAYAAGGVGLNGVQGEELNLDPYDAIIDFTNVLNSAVFTWPSQGNVLLTTGITYMPTLKSTIQKLNGMVIPAGLVVDIYFDCCVLNSATYPYGYTFIAQYDTTGGDPVTVNAQALMYEFDQAFGTSMANKSTTAGIPFQGFTDVRAVDYYADAVKWAKEAGVTAGTNTEGTAFSPAATVTRAEAVTFLWRAAGKPEPSSMVSPFSDVTDSDAYYYKAVLWAAEQGITNGNGGNGFGLNDTLTYDQILTFLCRAAGGSADGSDWSAAAVNWAKEKGLTDGLTFTAKADCPRADVVYCLWKQLGEDGNTGSAGSETAALSDMEAATAAILNGFLERKVSIDVAPYHIESSVLVALAREIADIDGKNPYNISMLNSYEPEGRQTKTLGVYYLMQTSSASQESENSPEVQARVQEIVNSVVTSDMSDYEIAKALHDWLVLNCEYDMRLYSGGMPYTSYAAYGALMDGTAVCAGYAKAYRLLMEAAGVECEYISGRARGAHAWNIVKIDGEWYHVDTTWDDPIPNKEGYVRYNYFLRSDTFMSKDHSGWTASHACISTKYDGTTLPTTTEQAKLEEQKADEERLKAVAADLLEFCFEAIDSLPYSTAAELQAAETLDGIDDGYPTIALPSGRYSASDLNKLREQLEAAISAKYPDYELSSLSSSSIRIKRNDVLAEIARRNAVKQEETDARVAEIEKIIQDAIREGDPRVSKYEVQVPDGYTSEEVSKTCKKMNAAGYSFDGYTAKVDYSIGSYSKVNVTVSNLRYSAWAEEETQRYVEQVEAAIANGEFLVHLQPGDYPDKDGDYYAFQAYNKVGREGYVTAAGLVAGEDYELVRGGSNSADVYTGRIRYLKLPELTTEEEYIAQIQDAIRNGKTSVNFQIESKDSSAFQSAARTMSQKGYTFDGYTYGENYRFSSYGNGSYGLYTINIVYPSAE